MDIRGKELDDMTPDELDAEALRLKRHWRAWDRQVARDYAALERSVQRRDAAERAYNLAARAAGLARSSVGGFALAALAMLGDNPQLV